MRTKKAPNPSPGPADLQQAPDTLPDGPNVAPSLHEHEAAMGAVGSAGDPDGVPGSEAALPPAADGAGRTDAGDPRLERIRAAAYGLSERRGFEPGHDVDDWLEAERQLDQGNASDTPAQQP